MSSPGRPQPLLSSGVSANLQRFGPLITSLPALIAGGVLAMALFLVPHTSQVSAIVLPTTSLPVQGSAPHRDLAPSLTPTADPATPPAAFPPTPTPTPPPTLPPSASLEGISGHRQSMPLSCEARSAVDWAAYFGTEIDEEKFFAGLPADENPEEGFVGDVQGSWGQIPPDDYGVHAKPIAQRLREYGLNAKSLRHMTLEELKGEIAAGRPVIVWVVGHVNRGTPVAYTAPGGAEITVAKFEHTVIVTAYGEHKITVQDGARVYSIYEGEFMKSWGVLENQAVIWID